MKEKFEVREMPRQARLDVAGTLHHIMLRGIEKKRIFDDDLDREGFVTGKQVQQIIAKSCKEERISLQELQRGSRRDLIPRVRSYLAWKMARELGVSLGELGRQLGVSTSAIPQILDREKMR